MQYVGEFFSNIPGRFLATETLSEYEPNSGSFLYTVSSFLICAAYLFLALLVFKYIYGKKNVRFHRAYFFFAALIFFGGITFLMDATVFWMPAFVFNGVIHFFTALLSWTAVFYIIRSFSKFMSAKTVVDLELEAEQNKILLRELESSNAALKKQNTLIENIFNSTTDYANIFDTSLNLISVNAVTEKFLKKPKEELIGKNFCELFPASIGSDYHNHLISAASGMEIINKKTVSPGGRHYESSFTPLLDNKIQFGVLVFARDITATVAREEELQKLNSELNIKNEELNKANVELEHFNYILSHDLQEPLRKIHVYSELAASKNKENQELIKVIRSADRMKALIMDVLQYSKAGSTQIDKEKISLDEVLNEVLMDLELTVKEKKAVIHSESLPEVVGIKYQLTQVFYNLIANALKYCEKEPCLEITQLAVTKGEGAAAKKYLEIRFKDNGIGFEEIYKKDIFSPFKRLNTDFEGTGIGLALVKRIVENHDGFVDVESKVGKGSVFKIVLPL